ncbi:hypothetical protein PybrP1_012088 [[Pythium] brassicae (nom. inval.)]|nr:hypothetical protein PybrP1_012088 [[Pythium] brassicae (nom. inval.)]
MTHVAHCKMFQHPRRTLTELHGYAVEFSPFADNLLAVGAAQYFGIIGNGRQSVYEMLPSGELALVRGFDTAEGVYDCAWSEVHPQQLLSACANGALKLWHLQTRDEFPIQNYHEHQQEVSGVNWSLVAKDAFVSASWDGTVKLWRPERAHSVLTLAEHTKAVYNAVWNTQNNALVASCSGDGTVKIWDLNAARSVTTIAAHGNEVLALDWNKYNQFEVVSGSADCRHPQPGAGSSAAHRTQLRGAAPQVLAARRGRDRERVVRHVGGHLEHQVAVPAAADGGAPPRVRVRCRLQPLCGRTGGVVLVGPAGCRVELLWWTSPLRLRVNVGSKSRLRIAGAVTFGIDAPMRDDALQTEITCAREALRRLEDGSADVLAVGYEQLTVLRQRQEARAHASFTRCQQSAAVLYTHECSQSEARYAARCEQLQREMGAELQRELTRLKNARDGVSVMDRRRPTRQSGKQEPKKRGGKGGASRGGGGSGGDYSDVGGYDLLQPAEALSPAEETYRQQQEEKKRLELLLSKTPVFKPLVHRVESAEAASDLDAITRVVAARSGAPLSRIANRRCRVAFPRIIRGARSSGSDSDSEMDSDEDEDMKVGDDDECAERARAASRRLEINPEMLQEGDEVVVRFRKKRERDGGSDSAQRAFRGVLTASTATLVFVRCEDSSFEALDVRDWKAGRIVVRAAAGKRRR